MNVESLLFGGLLAVVTAVVVIAFLRDGFRGDELPLSAPATSSVGPAAEGSANATRSGVGVPGMASMQTPALVAVAGRGRDTAKAGAAAVEPQNYVGPDIQLSEAHWQGMDAGPLDREVKRKLNYPLALRGVLVKEVTLNAARSGLLAGDVIVTVEGEPVTTLEEFQRQTRVLRNRRHARLTALRKGARENDGRFAMNRVSLVLEADSALGFAQVESAPMILPGDIPPHPRRGACTRCHAIGKGFELTPDPDLITLPPPPVSEAVVAGGRSVHRDRGPCVACHVITP